MTAHRGARAWRRPRDLRPSGRARPRARWRRLLVCAGRLGRVRVSNRSTDPQDDRFHQYERVPRVGIEPTRSVRSTGFHVLIDMVIHSIISVFFRLLTAHVSPTLPVFAPKG